jgi:hypothetical protein
LEKFAMTTAEPTFAVIEAHRQVISILDKAGGGPFEREKADLLAGYAIVEWAGLRKLSETVPTTSAGHSEMVGYIDDLLERHGNRYRASAYHGGLMDRRAASAEALKRRR